MIAFVAIAVAMVALGLAVLLLPLWRGSAPATVERARTNLGLLKGQLAELEAERAGGALDAEQYAETRAELERRVLDDAADAPDVPDAPDRQPAPASAATVSGGSAQWTALLLIVVVPLCALLLYWRLGDPALVDNPLLTSSTRGADGSRLTPEQLDTMVKQLRERLEREPSNAGGWLALARTEYERKRYAEAAGAYEKLVALVPDDAGVLADYADALAMANGRALAGVPLQLIDQALKLDPNQWKALAMAGTAAFERKDYSAAADYWERLQKGVPAEAPIARQIAGSIAEARRLAGASAGTAAAPPAAQAKSDGKRADKGAGKKADESAAADSAAKAANRSADRSGSKNAAEAAPARSPSAPVAAADGVSGTVTLADSLKAQAAPGDTVFIFARAAEGPRMPLAVMRVKVADLPARFAFDDGMAMSPNLKLSAFSQVVIGARISKSGRAGAARGDLEGFSAPVKLGSRDVKVTIDQSVQ